MKNNEKHLKFAVLATDVALFTVNDGKIYVRVMDVNRPPHFIHMSGLPGGLILPRETAEDAVIRILEEKGKINAKKVYIEQLYTFSSLKRDPRGRVVSVAYLALVPFENLSEKEKMNDKNIWWQEVYPKDKMAYDHDKILTVAIKRLKSRITYSTLASQLVPKEFTLTHLEKVCEIVLDGKIDKRNFRKKLLKNKIVKKSKLKLTGVKHRPAHLYTFSEKQVIEKEMI